MINMDAAEQAAATVSETWRIGHWRTAMVALSRMPASSHALIGALVMRNLERLHNPDARGEFTEHLSRAMFHGLSGKSHRPTEDRPLPAWMIGSALRSQFPGGERTVDMAFAWTGSFPLREIS